MSTARLGLSLVQHRVFTTPARFRTWIAGRRSGKSYLAVIECIAAALRRRRAMVRYIGPTLEQVRELAWEPLKRIIPPQYVAVVNESRLAVHLINGSLITLKSADRPERLRGPGLDFAVLDEFRWMDRNPVWEAVRPSLSDRGGRALFISTPYGMGWPYDNYVKGQEGDPEWASWQTTTVESGALTDAEINAARGDLDPRSFRQEYEASFESLGDRVYDYFDRRHNLAPVADTGGDLLVGMDFNINPMSWIEAVAVGDECHVLAALELPVSNTEEVAQEIRRRHPGRRIIVCPDPSGRQRRSSAGGITDFTILTRAGFMVDAPNAAPGIVDRINNTQAMLLNADGRRRCKIHPANCKPLVKALDGLTYKRAAGDVSTRVPDKTSGLDHIADALGYLLWQRFNVSVNRQVRSFLFRI